MNWPAKIREIRDSNGLTQHDLGERLGCRGLTVSRWERGIFIPVQYEGKIRQEFPAYFAGEQKG